LPLKTVKRINFISPRQNGRGRVIIIAKLEGIGERKKYSEVLEELNGEQKVHF
jgi:hypothetical protein